jgi:hypothetical protein
MPESAALPGWPAGTGLRCPLAGRPLHPLPQEDTPNGSGAAGRVGGWLNRHIALDCVTSGDFGMPRTIRYRWARCKREERTVPVGGVADIQYPPPIILYVYQLFQCRGAMVGGAYKALICASRTASAVFMSQDAVAAISGGTG